jgi:hypothetical protein
MMLAAVNEGLEGIEAGHPREHAACECADAQVNCHMQRPAVLSTAGALQKLRSVRVDDFTHAL